MLEQVLNLKGVFPTHPCKALMGVHRSAHYKLLQTKPHSRQIGAILAAYGVGKLRRRAANCPKCTPAWASPEFGWCPELLHLLLMYTIK